MDIKLIVRLLICNILLLITIQYVISSEQLSSTTGNSLIFVAMAAMTASILYEIKDKYNPVFIIASITVFCMFFTLIYYLYDTGSDFGSSLFKYSIYVVTAFGVLIALTMLYRSIERAINNDNSLVGFVFGMIFFIPCMINDFIEYIKNEYNLTPPVAYILFVIEVLVILLFLAISHIPKITMNLGGFPIAREVIFLDSEYIYKNIEQPKDILHVNNRYSISFWTFVNQRTYSSDIDINIFSYGIEDSWKPRVVFSGTKGSYTENKKDTYKITLADKKETEIQLSSQVWHNFVFNYDATNVDLFIDGSLVRSFAGTSQYNQTTDLFKTGEKSGLYGAICNITYYNEPLTIREITSAYNLLNGQNPPINNI